MGGGKDKEGVREEAGGGGREKAGRREEEATGSHHFIHGCNYTAECPIS